MDPPPEVVLRLPAGTVGLFFFLEVTVFLSSLRRTGEKSIVDRALRKAISACLSMTLRQDLLTRWKLLQLKNVYV
jgi:hypothetical protein